LRHNIPKLFDIESFKLSAEHFFPLSCQL
jgi:hypothetical protein